MNLRLTFLASSIAVAAIAGCYTGSAVDTNRPVPAVDTEPTEPVDGDPDPPPSSVGEMKGLPCDVAVLINTTCGKCHGADGPEVKIASWEDLTAKSEFDPSKSVAELALARMKSKSRPMPPAGNLGKDEIAVLGEWIEGGMKKGTCEPPKPEPKKDAGPITEPPPVEVDAGADAAAPVPVCEPGSTEPGGLMRPGQACLGCHDGSGRPRKFAAAGTVFSSLAMPSDCNGESGTTSGMKVILAGANGTIRVLPVNAAGNFALPEVTLADGGAPPASAEALSKPFKAIVVRGNQIREMKGTREVADCNGCHTERGRNGAPGRVLAP